MNFEKPSTTVVKADSFQNNITSKDSITHPATVGSVHVSKNNISGMASASKFSTPSSSQSTDFVNEVINLYY
jgi:hypothetical protein